MWRVRSYAVEKSQGTTEYLIMLAIILLIAATVISFLVAIRPPAISITGSAEKSGESVVFTPSTAMTPDSIPATEWEYAVYSDSTVVKDWDSTQVALERGIPVSLTAPGNQSGDTLKIRYKGAVYDTLIS